MTIDASNVYVSTSIVVYDLPVACVSSQHIIQLSDSFVSLITHLKSMMFNEVICICDQIIQITLFCLHFFINDFNCNILWQTGLKIGFIICNTAIQI